MKRKSGGCCSGCLFVVLVLLLADSWLASSWPLRALELLTAGAVVVALTYRERRRLRGATSTQPAAVYVPPPDGFAAAAQDITEKARAEGQD